jgi:allophanate hydrolase
VRFAVVAAHRRGQPLHHELVALGARFAQACPTAPLYRLLALPGPGVPRGGLVRVDTDGASVEVEVHRLPPPGVIRLRLALPAPLEVGEVGLADGTSVAGIVCAASALGMPGTLDVTGHGSWPAYLAWV